MGYIGGYELHLYCDYPGCPRGLSKGAAKIDTETKRKAFSMARRQGWKIVESGSAATNGNGRCYCPEHSRQKGGA